MIVQNVCFFNLVDCLNFYKCSSTVHKEYNRVNNLSKLFLCGIYSVGSGYPVPDLPHVAPNYPDPVGKKHIRHTPTSIACRPIPLREEYKGKKPFSISKTEYLNCILKYEIKE